MQRLMKTEKEIWLCLGLDVRGGGPASRDSQMLNPLMTMQEIHAVVLSVGEVSADMDLVGALAAEVTSEAILRAVSSAKAAYGFVSASEFVKS